MTFIRNYRAPESMIGEEAKLIRDCSAMKGTIPKGSIVKIIAVGDRGFDIQDLDSGEILIECGLDCIDW